LCGYFATKSIWIHVIDKRALPVDLQYGEPLPVPRLQSRIAVDLDLLELERDLEPDPCHDLSRTIAKMATLRVVENDLQFAWSSHDPRRLSSIALA
jgi:hypothetical protein